MALTNLPAEFWQNTVLAGLRKDLVADMICNKRFKEEVFGKGDRLHILSMGTLTAQTYGDGNITYEDLTDSNLNLDIDTDYYTAFKSEDVDRAKISTEYLAEVLVDAGYQHGDKWDIKVMEEYANAGLDSYSTGTTAWQITATTASNIPALYGAIKRQLRKANAPKGDIYFVAPPEIEEAMTLYFGNKGPSSQLSDRYVENGSYGGRFFGVETFFTNNCQTATSVTHGLAGVMGTSIALANDVIADEKLRLEGRIADGQRMLSLGGVKTYRPAVSIDVNLNETVIATS